MIRGNGNGRRTLAAVAKRAEPIAIIGMAGRFPGARDTGEYWTNLANGVESIAILSQEEMRDAGVPEAISKLPGYVNASPVLDGVDKFDAQFFGFSARDAALTDPQHRVFLETAWEALEDAGYDPDRYPGDVGVFGGCELSSYLYHLYQNLESLKYIDGMQLMVTNDKDHLCTQVSYRMNLRGPSVAVQTTCSTSLVAVALACESLHHRRCDIALAGGVTVKVPQRGGYFYTAGSILSPDGHCRPFDAKAQGTIVGSGSGIVVLKRLKDAVAEADNIRAVILGVGINNDGNDKVGYTAPSTRGQAAAIRAAHRSAGISADSVGYVEAHGTGTILGDPIEVSALTEVFRESTEKRGYCGIGSAKSNFGHLSCAAGVAGLIKAVLALEHEAIPPTVHYTAPNPAIDLLSSPFYVTTSLTGWDRNGGPRRAGVSSFGVGGTNAHVVIEEGPAPPSLRKSRGHQVFTISARSEAALEEASKRLARHLLNQSGIDLADAAFTLHVGRRVFKWRRAIVAGSDERERLAQALEQSEASGATAAPNDRAVVFMFPGQGAQYPGMAAGLYQTEPVVRRAIDRCAGLLKPSLGADLKKLIFPSRRDRGEAAEALRNTKWAQPALFTVGYALAELWTSWGIKPSAMIGHSVGEYVAATLAGVMTLEDALSIIALRGRLISELPRGSMFAVMGSPETLLRCVTDGISVAAINAPGFTVLSGPSGAMARLEQELARERIAVRRLHTSHAFHSSMMDPILPEFEDAVARLLLTKPQKPFVSTLTGRWAGEDVVEPSYWSRQLRSPVLFAEAIRTLISPGSAAGKDPIWLEAGPGTTLSTFAREVAKEKGVAATCLPSLQGADARRPDSEEILTTLGQLWAKGVEVDWHGFHGGERRCRVSLPTYPFERQSYWVGANPAAQREEARDPYNWFYRSVWREEALKSPRSDGALTGKRVLVLDQPTSPGAAIAAHLREIGCEVVVVRPAETYARVHEHEYTLDLSDDTGFRDLAAAVCSGAERLGAVVDCFSAVGVDASVPTSLDSAAKTSLWAPMRLAHAVSRQTTVRPLPYLILASGTAHVSETDVLDPNRALSSGIARVIPQEYPGLRVCHIDVDNGEEVPAIIAAELAAGVPEPALAVRGARRFVEAFDPVPLRQSKPPLNLPHSPVVMITGGLGHMGLHLAEALFSRIRAKLVLVARTSLPAPETWAAQLQEPDIAPQQKAILQRLQKMRAERDDIMVLTADLNDAGQVQAAVNAALARFGVIDMVIHGTARIDAAAFGTVSQTDMRVIEAQFSPKLRGLSNTMEAMRGHPPARWVLHSSISSVLGGLALGAYAAANAVLDAIALQQGITWLSIDWDAWDNAAEAQNTTLPSAIIPREGSEVLLRLLGNWESSRVLVGINFGERLKAWVQHSDAAPKEEKATMERHPRPNLTTTLVEPRTETESILAGIWGSQLGLQVVGVHDRFFDLGGHSLLAAQIAAEICDRFQIELPVLNLFQAPTVAELAVLVDQARAGAVAKPDEKAFAPAGSPAPELEGNAPEVAAKAGYREFYDDVTRRLEQSGLGAASFFLNYGYVSIDSNDEARVEVPAETFNRNSVGLAFELIGSTELNGKQVLDVGCGRGGTAALFGEIFGAQATGVDLSPEAIAFCRRTHGDKAQFEVGDAEHLPFEDGRFDVVTNMESSHTYPNLRAFFGEVKRVLASGGLFLYTDLLPLQRWAEVKVLLASLGFRIGTQRDITANVLASCDEVATNRTKAFGGSSEAIDNFLAVPGSAVYEQMRSNAWEYRILRAVRG
jgi:acyl transferase domain-containing protein/ubiquinone/menaquinone biosynthesis C-methylase UbiE